MKFFDEYGIDYDEYNFFSKDLTYDAVTKILQLTTSGFEEIISTRSLVYQNNQELLAKMNVSQQIEFIIENPSILKRPIVVDTGRNELLVGFNKTEIEDFLEI